MRGKVDERKGEKMNQWIRADFDLGLPYRVLIIRYWDLMTRGFSILDTLKDTLPETVAGTINDFIQDARPDLSGGRVVSLRLDVVKKWWEVGYLHFSFPSTPTGQEAEKIFLFPWIALGTQPEQEPVNRMTAPPISQTTEGEGSFPVPRTAEGEDPFEEIRRDIQQRREARPTWRIVKSNE